MSDAARLGAAADTLTERAIALAPILGLSPAFRELMRREAAERLLAEPALVEAVERDGWETDR